MTEFETLVAVFADHEGADAAVKKLAAEGIDIKHPAWSVRDTTPTKRS